LLDGLAKDEENFGLFRVHIHLEDPECIPLGIDEIALPARLWDREFGQCHNAPELLDYPCCLIKVFHFQRTDKGIRAARVGGVFAGRFSNPPRDPPVSIRQ